MDNNGKLRENYGSFVQDDSEQSRKTYHAPKLMKLGPIHAALLCTSGSSCDGGFPCTNS